MSGIVFKMFFPKQCKKLKHKTLGLYIREPHVFCLNVRPRPYIVWKRILHFSSTLVLSILVLLEVLWWSLHKDLDSLSMGISKCTYVWRTMSSVMQRFTKETSPKLWNFQVHLEKHLFSVWCFLPKPTQSTPKPYSQICSCKSIPIAPLGKIVEAMPSRFWSNLCKVLLYCIALSKYAYKMNIIFSKKEKTSIQPLQLVSIVFKFKQVNALQTWDTNPKQGPTFSLWKRTPSTTTTTTHIPWSHLVPPKDKDGGVDSGQALVQLIIPNGLKARIQS